MMDNTQNEEKQFASFWPTYMRISSSQGEPKSSAAAIFV